MAAKNIDSLSNGIDPKSIETGAQDWNYSCGVCHVGGGQMEYDRDRNPYSATSPSGDANYYSYIDDQIVAGFMSDTNKAEVDCLLCHLNDGSGMSGNGRAWLQSLGCGSSMPLGPINDPTCTGTSGIPGVPAAGMFTPGTDYDMYNRNLALKTMQFNLAASLGLGATVSGWNPDGTIASITGVPSTITADNIQATPKSQNCSVCHARDDNTPGLPGMINMKYGYGNYAMINPAGTAMDIDKDPNLQVANDVLWFELGCKTGMGKRAHRIGQGPNANWGMSMFNVMFGLGKNPGDPITNQTWDFSSMGMGNLTVKERMPDADIHDMAGMQCASCHYTLGSTELEGGSRTFPAGEHHGVSYPSETVLGIDHNFAQADSLKDTYGTNYLDGTVSCEACHTTRTHPRLTDNGGTLVSPTPAHAGFPSVHLEKIGCATCHIPETYSAPGRLKYRDHSVGYYKKGVETNGGFRNMLDWNYDLITGSHKTVPSLYVWATKEGEKKIYPVLPSEMPIWVKGNAGGNGEAGSADGVLPDSTPTGTSPAPAYSRDVIVAAQASEAAGVLRRANEINGGNMVPLFDGFSLADAWAVDTAARQNDMASRGGFAKLKVFHAAFDVTHGVVDKEWALGGSKRGGCVSCHSSIDKMARNEYGQPTGPNPSYSENSVGFFESYQQPLQNTDYSFGVGQYDLVKNWFSLFADYDCTMMCGGGMQPDSTYFDPFTGNPNMGAACGDPFGMGWTNLGSCVNFMAGTFDKAMGFPSGTAMMMGMYDGIAGLQGFVVRETVSGATLGCQPFAGPANSSVAQAFGVNVNNCVPNGAPFNGTCSGAALPGSPWPASCVSGFRNGQGCAMDIDCQGAMTDSTELSKNPMGLLYSRDEVRKQFKITIQNAGKLTWPIAIEQNPSNPAHVASWDQANNCVTDMGMPVACGTVSSQCQGQGGTCINVRTWVNGNELLGYTSSRQAALTNLNNCAACHTVNMAIMKHPAGTGTPATCASCHTTQHQSAISADVACGQCHGGSQGASATKNGAMYFDETVLVVYAAGMHDASKLPPTVAHTTLVSPVLKGSAVTFVDASKDNNSESIASIYVNWGDGQTQTGAAGATFSHTYANTSKYNVVHTATDAGGRMASELIPVQVMAGSTTKTRITVTVTQSNGTTPISGARIYLKKAGVLKTTGYSNTSGVWTFSNLLPAADYTVEVYKSGVNFGKGTGKMSTAATVDASADAVLTVTAVTP